MSSLKDVEVVFQNCDESTKQSVLNQLASDAEYLVLPDRCTAAFIADNIMLIDGEGQADVLKRALEELGSDNWACMPDEFKVGGTD
jgi:hypothetical protein